MKIGIDISQMAYSNTGVANYMKNLLENLLMIDKENEYILFYSSLRNNFQFSIFNFQSKMNVTIRKFKFPPALLDLLWNRLHIIPIENLIGDIDVFISSDWTQPPTRKAKKMTILYDLIVYKFPDQTAAQIVEVQKRRLKWVKKECDMIICISESTKQDAHNLLGIDDARLRAVYPGIT